MKDVFVLCHHALSHDWPAALSVRPDRFAEQLELLAARGYRGVTFAEALRGPVRGKTVAVTFDDAFVSVVEHAFPVLQALGMPATIFAVTDFAASGQALCWDGIDQWRGGPHDDELAGLGWDRLRSLQEAGWEVGSHTRTHPRLTELDDETLAHELRDSRVACEEALGRPCESIAYPYGDVDARVVAAADAAGYRYGAALPARRHLPRQLEWPRIGVFRVDDNRRFRLKASRLVRATRLVLRR